MKYNYSDFEVKTHFDDEITKDNAEKKVKSFLDAHGRTNMPKTVTTTSGTNNDQYTIKAQFTVNVHNESTQPDENIDVTMSLTVKKNKVTALSYDKALDENVYPGPLPFDHSQANHNTNYTNNEIENSRYNEAIETWENSQQNVHGEESTFLIDLANANIFGLQLVPTNYNNTIFKNSAAQGIDKGIVILLLATKDLPIKKRIILLDKYKNLKKNQREQFLSSEDNVNQQNKTDAENFINEYDKSYSQQMAQCACDLIGLKSNELTSGSNMWQPDTTDFSSSYSCDGKTVKRSILTKQLHFKNPNSNMFVIPLKLCINFSTPYPAGTPTTAEKHIEVHPDSQDLYELLSHLGDLDTDLIQCLYDNFSKDVNGVKTLDVEKLKTTLILPIPKNLNIRGYLFAVHKLETLCKSWLKSPNVKNLKGYIENTLSILRNPKLQNHNKKELLTHINNLNTAFNKQDNDQGNDRPNRIIEKTYTLNSKITALRAADLSDEITDKSTKLADIKKSKKDYKEAKEEIPKLKKELKILKRQRKSLNEIYDSANEYITTHDYKTPTDCGRQENIIPLLQSTNTLSLDNTPKNLQTNLAEIAKFKSISSSQNKAATKVIASATTFAGLCMIGLGLVLAATGIGAIPGGILVAEGAMTLGLIGGAAGYGKLKSPKRHTAKGAEVYHKAVEEAQSITAQLSNTSMRKTLGDLRITSISSASKPNA